MVGVIKGGQLYNLYNISKVKNKYYTITNIKAKIDAHFIIFCRNESTVHFVVTTPEPILFKSMYTKAERHTGEYLSEKILESIE